MHKAGALTGDGSRYATNSAADICLILSVVVETQVAPVSCDALAHTSIFGIVVAQLETSKLIEAINKAFMSVFERYGVKPIFHSDYSKFCRGVKEFAIIVIIFKLNLF